MDRKPPTGTADTESAPLRSSLEPKPNFGPGVDAPENEPDDSNRNSPYFKGKLNHRKWVCRCGHTTSEHEQQPFPDHKGSFYSLHGCLECACEAFDRDFEREIDEAPVTVDPPTSVEK